MKRAFIVIALIAIAGYGLFESRRLIKGPQITILSPANGSATSSPLVVISGIAQNISFLTINDAPAFTDESGHFFEVVSPPEGYAIFTVQALDRFGRRAKSQVKITVLNYCPVSES